MALLLKSLRLNIGRVKYVVELSSNRLISTTSIVSAGRRLSDVNQSEKESNNLQEGDQVISYGLNDMEKRKNLRRPQHTWEISVKYMESETYKSIYGDKPVWKPYRRNTAKPFFIRPLPRTSCVKEGKFITNWPCPICRDEYLVVDYRNVKLLKQFVIPSTGQLYDNYLVNVCRLNYFALQVEVMKAKNRGYLIFDLPFRNFNYKDYYAWWDKPDEEPVPEEPELYETGHENPYVMYPTHNPEYIPLY